MSDDLVQRLRNPSGDLESDDWVQDMWGEAAPSKKLREAAADRIEALEAALERIAASGWPSDLRQDPPQAIAREALDA